MINDKKERMFDFFSVPHNFSLESLCGKIDKGIYMNI